jgi:cytosine/adenosine deaminase-related metal-dependent hydrolase
MRVYLARHLYPVASPPVVDGAVAVEGGRIALVGARDNVLESVPAGSEVRDLGASAILPGLVNAHTHLELSWLASCRPRGGDLVGWIRELLGAREAEDPSEARRCAEAELERMLDRGTVAVGDIANRSWCGPLVAGSGLHGVLFHEVFRFRGADAQQTLSSATSARDDLERSIDRTESRLRAAVAPHAAHTSSATLLRGLSHVGEDRGDPLSLHLAESPDESRFLLDGSGPFRELLEERGGWDPSWQAPGVSPVQYADRVGLLSPRTLAVHCVQLDAQDHGTLQRRGVTVVTCPRSNAYLGVGTAPVCALLAEGIPVALGTDSLVSAPDLDLFGEVAAALRTHPQLSPAAVLRIATVNGARALRVDDRLGTIEAGKLAELVVLPLHSETEDPLESLRDVPERVHRIDRADWERR